jgi:hypothetical protein
VGERADITTKKLFLQKITKNLNKLVYIRAKILYNVICINIMPYNVVKKIICLVYVWGFKYMAQLQLKLCFAHMEIIWG